MASFTTTVHNSGRRFTIPKAARSKLGIEGGDSVFLTIASDNQTVLYKGRETLKSGPEIYGREISSALNPGSTIHVEATRPVAGTRRLPYPSDGSPRRYWIVSPNVTNNRNTVADWKSKSIDFSAAFMGWQSDPGNHSGLGYKFAHSINPGDIILIARSYGQQPDIVGLGVVRGPSRKTLRGFTAPEGDHWRGSIRELSPFIARRNIPANLGLMNFLGKNRKALRELVRARSNDERLVCNWLDSQLSTMIGSRTKSTRRPRTSSGTTLSNLPHNGELDYRVNTKKQVKLAKRREADLVRHYDQWLQGRNYTLRVANYGGLMCDAYEERRNNLIEAKSSIKREHIRMAVGQLLDYAHLGEAVMGRPNLAILLPQRPKSEIESWLKDKLKISVIWREGNVFSDNAQGRFT